MQVRDVQFLRANTSRLIKITVPGPFTMSQQAQNDAYPSEGELALAYAGAVHDEIVDLFAAGADIVQIDEPYMQARPEKAREFGLAALERALEGVVGTTARPHLLRVRRDHPRAPVRILVPPRAGRLLVRPDLDRDGPVRSSTRRSSAKLPEKRIILGVINLDDMEVESPETVAARIRAGSPAQASRRVGRSAPTAA